MMPRPSPHPWWTYLPPERRSRRAYAQLWWRRARAFLWQRRQRILLSLGVYLILCLLPLGFGMAPATIVALLPLALVPPVGYLVYWLVWKEFHH